MKYNRLPLVVYLMGVGICLTIVLPAASTLISISDADYTPDIGILTALLGVLILGGLIVYSMCANISTDMELEHYRNILKKHGLWQDEAIKKKDLPK